jgi:hypothetical protein
MGITTIGNTIIGDILDQNMNVLPLAIDPLRHFGPILQQFLFNIQPSSQLIFTPTKPITTFMYSKVMHFPSPKGVLKLAGHNWKTTQSHQFYGHLCSAPTPTITTLQKLGLILTKVFTLHVRYATCKFHDLPTPSPSGLDPPYFGQ